MQEATDTPQCGDKFTRQFVAVLGVGPPSCVARVPDKALWEACMCVREYGTEGEGQAGRRNG